MNWKYRSIAILAMLFLMHLIAHIDRNLLVAFAPQIIGEISISNSQFGFLAGGVWVLSYSTASILTGALSDRYSRTRILAVAVLIWSGCTVASGFAMSFGQMTLARLLVACGEAGLVPPALSLLLDLFSARRLSTASGVFFMGLPLGIGGAFVIAGISGEALGWRGSFYLLGALGVLLAVPMFLVRDERVARVPEPDQRGFPQQFRTAWADLKATPVVIYTMFGFVVIHIMFASLAFLQVWLVSEKGFVAAEIARSVGILQIVFGVLGALSGGALSDRFSRKLPGGHATFVVLLLALCGPVMLIRFFAPTDSLAFYVGLCASFYLPMAVYGPANAMLQGLTPARSRSLLTGFNILIINVVAVAIGTSLVGIFSDRLKAAGSTQPLSTAMIGADIATLCAVFFFAMAAVHLRRTSAAVSEPPLMHP